MNNDKSLNYEYVDVKDNKQYDSKKGTYDIIIEHKKHEKLNIIIRFSDSKKITVIRPTNNESKVYKERFIDFIEKENKLADSFLRNIKYIGEYPSEEII